jgi:hypothetical protein
MTLIIPIPQGARELNVVTIFYMKSYGLKWENSTARIDLTNPDLAATPVTSSTIYGIHNKHTAEAYTAEIRLPQPAKNSLRVDIHHVAGTTFKIQGIAVCA